MTNDYSKNYKYNYPTYDLPWERQKTQGPLADDDEFNIYDVKDFYTTELTEDKRTTFDEAYPKEDYYNNERTTLSTSDPFLFYESILDNKKALTEAMGITGEQYDALGCIALALASQETGMGLEKGYAKENGWGLFSIARKLGIMATSEHSASSGLTQIKIYDQLQGDVERFYASAMKARGVEAKGKAIDNLDDPKIAAVATMVVLENIVQNYDDYEWEMEFKHRELEKDFENKDINPEQAEEKGFNYLSDIYGEYQNMSDEEKKETRDNLKYLFLSEDGTTKENPSDDGQKYTEEIQFNKLKEIFKGKIDFDDDAINYMRFAMCSPDCRMDITEYCAYAWNCGIKGTGMQPDRLISAKFGLILAEPEKFDPEHYSANVVALVEKYAQQSNEDNPYFSVEDALKTHIFTR